MLGMEGGGSHGRRHGLPYVGLYIDVKDRSGVMCLCIVSVLYKKQEIFFFFLRFFFFKLYWSIFDLGFPGSTVVKNPPANAGDTRDTGLIPGSRRSQEKEMATHCRTLAWKNPVDGGAWQATWDHKESIRTWQRITHTHSWSSMLCWFFLYSEVTRLYIQTQTHTGVFFSFS